MKTRRILPLTLVAAAVVVVALPPSSRAESSNPPPSAEREAGDVALGLSTTIESVPEASSGSLGDLATGLRLAFQLPNQWQIEPRVRADFDRERSRRPGLGALGGLQGRGDTDSDIQVRTYKRRSWKLGGSVGLHRVWSITDQTRAIFGGAVGASYRRSRHLVEPARPEETNLFSTGPTETFSIHAGPVLGGEVFLTRSFSIGLEGKLAGYFSSTSGPGTSDGDLTPDARSFGISRYGGLFFSLHL